jgi:hypothetical protein
MENRAQVVAGLIEYIGTTPQVTNACMKVWLARHHSIRGAQADEMIAEVRAHYRNERVPIVSRETVLIGRAAQYRDEGYDANTARTMSRMYR